MLKIKNLCKSFEEKSVIDNFSFEFPTSGLVTLMGESGKGKTTLLNIISGLITQDSGSVENTYHSLSYSFQEDRLFPWLTVRKNIELVLDGVEDKKERAEFWLDAMELSDFADYLPEKLSGGMRQRASLARAIAYPSELVLLDEPFSNLDEALHKKIYAIILREAESRLIIMVTHNKEDASQINLNI